jgi:hypothetical protein
MTKMEELFVYWVKEREAIRVKKEAGAPKPWTDDPIFQTYKFTNVRREDDTVSRWIMDNWIKRYDSHPNMWFAMIVARLFNWPPTLDILGFPNFNSDKSNVANFADWKDRARHKLKYLRDERKEKVFTGAYLVSTNGVKMDKIDYILDHVLTPIWERGLSPSQIQNTWSDAPLRLEEYWNHLLQFDGLGSFMAGQVIADLKFAFDLENAPDWYTWAPLGPGSIRGLNRLYGRPVDKSLRQDKGLLEIREVQKLIEDQLEWDIPAHNVQNCLCEFDKYLRVKNNEGRPRSLYPGVM